MREIKIRHNLSDNQKITTCNTKQELQDFTRMIMTENDDDMPTQTIEDCKAYINTYCDNLDLL